MTNAPHCLSGNLIVKICCIMATRSSSEGVMSFMWGFRNGGFSNGVM